MLLLMHTHCLAHMHEGFLTYPMYPHREKSNPTSKFIECKTPLLKETKSATTNIFRFFYFLFKLFVKVELSYVFTKNLFTIAKNYTEK